MSSDKSENECDLHDDISDDESIEKVVQPKKKAKTTVGDVKKATTATVVKEKAPRAKASKPPAVKKDTGIIKVVKPSNSKSKEAVENSNALTTVSNNITTTGPTIDINSSSSSSSSSYQSHAYNPQQDITRGSDINTEAAAKKLILQYLRQQNRPYSAIQIYDNLHKRITKPLIERVLNAACASNDCDLICKEYGKAKIYFIDQNTMTSNYTTAELDQLIYDNSELKKEVDTMIGEEKRYKQMLQALMDEPSDDALDR